MASISIACGPPRARRYSTNSLGRYIPKPKPTKAKRRAYVDSIKNNRFATLAVDTTRKSSATGFRGPRPGAARPTTGSWGKKLTVNMDPVKRLKCVPDSKAKPVKKGLTRPCAYCHDKVNIHHIRNCPILAEKNRLKMEKSLKEKALKAEERKRQARVNLAERVRLAQEQSKVKVEVVEESDSDSDSDDNCNFENNFPKLQAAITSGKVSTRRGSPRVTFKDDNIDTLMKPPCETKIFDVEAPPSAISSDEDAQVYPDEEEYLKRKQSKTAWKPRFQRTAHEQQKQLDAQKKEKKPRWADMCDAWEEDKEAMQADMTAQEKQVILNRISAAQKELSVLQQENSGSWANAGDEDELEEEIASLEARLLLASGFELRM